MSTAELAISYAALLLHDDGAPITAENLTKVVQAANVTVDPYWAPLFAKLFETRSIEDLICNVGAGGGAAPAAASGGAAAGGDAPAAEEAKEESEEEESDDDMGFSLFD